MAIKFPQQIDNFSIKTANEIIQSTHINDLQDVIVAIEVFIKALESVLDNHLEDAGAHQSFQIDVSTIADLDTTNLQTTLESFKDFVDASLLALSNEIDQKINDHSELQIDLAHPIGTLPGSRITDGTITGSKIQNSTISIDKLDFDLATQVELDSVISRIDQLEIELDLKVDTSGDQTVAGSKTFTDSGIFDVNSTSSALRITQQGSGNALLVEDSANPDSTGFVIKNDGATGIGTIAPARKLEVQSGSTSEIAARFAKFSSSTQYLEIGSTLTSNSLKSYSAPDDGQPLVLEATSTDNQPITSGSVYLGFNTMGVERARITSDGYFLIGSTTASAPGAKLSISSNSSIQENLRLTQTGGGANLVALGSKNLFFKEIVLPAEVTYYTQNDSSNFQVRKQSIKEITSTLTPDGYTRLVVPDSSFFSDIVNVIDGLEVFELSTGVKTNTTIVEIENATTLKLDNDYPQVSSGWYARNKIKASPLLGISSLGVLEVNGLRVKSNTDANIFLEDNTTIVGNLTVGGSAAFSGALISGGNLTTQQISATGLTTTSSTVSVTSPSFIAKNATLSNSLSIGENLTVAGDQNLTGSLIVGNNQTVDGYLFVGDSGTFDENLVVHGQLVANSGLNTSSIDASSNVNILGTLYVKESTTLDNTLTVGGNTTVAGDLTISGSLIASGLGNVVGPASSLDLSLARFDGTSGKTLQSSLATLDDFGLLTSPTMETGTLTATSAVVVNGSNGLTTTLTTFNLLNINATTINFAGASTTLNIGSSSGLTTVNNFLTASKGLSVSQNLTVAQNLKVAGSTTVDGYVKMLSYLNVDGYVATPYTQIDYLITNSQSLAISSNAITIAKGFVFLTGGTQLNTVSGLSNGQQVTLINTSGSLIRLTNLGNILTGTNTDFLLRANAAVTLVYNSSTGKAYVSGGTTGVDVWTSVVSAATLAPGLKYFADTSGGIFTLTFPSVASTGDTIVISDPSQSWGTYNLTLAPGSGSQKINGGTAGANLVLSIPNKTYTFVYFESASNWVLLRGTSSYG